MWRTLRSAVLAAGVLCTSACPEPSPGPVTPPVVNSTPSTIEISPSGSITLDALQATQAMSATVKNSSGAVVSDNVTWTSDASTIASVSTSGGIITANANGTAHVTASTSNGKSSSPLTVLVQQKASQLAIVSGDAQQGTVNTALSAPLVVRATDRNSNAMANVGVSFTTTDGTLGTSTTSTGSDGRASTTWTLPKTKGKVVTTAALTSDPSKTAQFSGTANAGAATGIQKAIGDGQRGSVNSPLPTQIVAAAVDAFGNSVPNIRIDFSVIAGGGSNTAGGLTNTDGQIAVTWTLGPDSLAPQQLQAYNTTLNFTPVTFSARGVRAAMDGLGPPTFKAGCHMTGAIHGVTQADLGAISVTFDGLPGTGITLTNVVGRDATLTVVAPTLSRTNGTLIPVVIKVYSQTFSNQNLIYDTTTSCS